MNATFPGLPKPLSVLIVEDEARLRELLAEVIPGMGYSVSAARSAEESLRIMETDARDILLLDLNLLAMDGMELFGIVRKKWPATEVIVLTGFGDLAAAKQAIHLDVVEFLTKPCPLNQIDLALDRTRRRIAARVQRDTPTAPAQIPSPPSSTPETLEQHERKMILATLERNGGNRTATAQELGISRRTLHYRLAEYARGAK